MKIMVATDGSRTSAAAVRFAGQIASATRGRLEVVTVGELSPSVVSEGSDSDALAVLERAELRTARAALNRARRDMRRAAVPERPGAPAQPMTEHARNSASQLSS